MVNNQQIFLYNTLKNKLEPLDPSLKEIKIYVCGPTVYNHLHIGNGRIQVVYDSLVRFLKHYYPKIKYVSNITDIDDKILNKANEELKSWEEISNYYTEEFIMVLKYLNITNIDILCKATDNIDCIKDDIYNMINKGIAYSTQKGNIYFNTQIDHIKDFYTTITKNQGANENIRIVSEEEKKNPKDFALWKKNNLLFKSKQLTDGMPGWHTECSSMAKKYLGNVSIHGGGLDLLFPHHTNENIQHYGLYGEELSKIWTHVDRKSVV